MSKKYALPSLKDMNRSLQTVSEEDFLADLPSYLPIAFRTKSPSADTLTTYLSHINQFLAWCKQINYSPFALTVQHLTYFRDWLLQCGLKPATVTLKLTAIRHFFQAAQHYNITQTNPIQLLSVPAKKPTLSAPPQKSLSLDDLYQLFSLFPAELSAAELRSKLILSFMALEGLRTIELHNMNREDIDFTFSSIRIGNTVIYPREDTFTLLRQYLSSKSPQPDKTAPSPVFTVLGNHNRNQRMSRQSIRNCVNDCLERSGLKQKGISCNIQRYSCGVLLYQQTGDLGIVQKTLRHKDKQLLSKYSETTASGTRYTSLISLDTKK